MAAMQASAKNFAAQLNEDEDDDQEICSEEIETNTGTINVEDAASFLCIICQQGSSVKSRMGLLCLTQSSRVFSTSTSRLSNQTESHNHRFHACLKFCGHSMHDSCFESFCLAEYQKQEFRTNVFLKGAFYFLSFCVNLFKHCSSSISW